MDTLKREKMIVSKITQPKLGLVLILLCLVSCYPKDRVESRFIKITNNTKQDLIFILSERGEFKKPFYEEDLLTLSPNMIDSLSCSDFSWDDMIKKSDNNKLNIYIIKKNSLDNYGGQMDSIFKNQEFYKRCSFDIEFIKKNSWEIVFK
jgi:hypothetical protein